MSEIAKIDVTDFPGWKRQRNQSPEHRELSARALCWLGARATGRGVVGATEIALQRDYIADAVAIVGFQYRFLLRYLKANTTRGVVNEFVCVFEVKVTRADFLSTFGPSDKHENRRYPVGQMHWCVTPRGLIDPKELPDWWGLLEASGRGLRETKAPRMFPYNEPNLFGVAYRLLMYGTRRAGDWLRIPVCPQCEGPLPDIAEDEASAT